MSTMIKTPAMRPMVAAQVPAHVADQVEVRDGAHAIEVSALFEDAVQEVRHLDNPAGGKVSGLTKALLGSAAASLAGVCMLFSTSYVQVAKEREATERGELSVAKNARSSGKAADYGAAGLLCFGTSALMYGLWRRAGERKENEFSIGADALATFNTTGDGLPSQRFPLVRSTGTDYELLFTPAMHGDVTVDGKTSSLTDWATAGRAQPAAGVTGALATMIPRGARFCVQHGASTFLIHSVARPRQYPVPLRLDWQQQSYTAAVLAGAGLFMGLMFSVPADPKSLSIDSFLNEHLTKISITPPAAPEDKAPLVTADKVTAPPSSSKAHKGPSGKMGTATGTKIAHQLQVKGPKDNLDTQLKRQAASEAARNMGVLGALNGMRSTAVAALFTGGSALGNDAANALDSIDGKATGDAYGNDGMGYVGTQRGGVGALDGPIGTSVIGGQSQVGGHDYLHGKPPALRAHRATGPEAAPQPVKIVGTMDKELIRRVIRSHMNQVKFCYESELTRNGKLEGRVQVQFLISNTGTVLSSVVQSSTLGSQQTESCIANAVRRWEFPAPQTGVVSVLYPFVLKTAGE